MAAGSWSQRLAMARPAAGPLGHAAQPNAQDGAAIAAVGSGGREAFAYGNSMPSFVFVICDRETSKHARRCPPMALAPALAWFQTVTVRLASKTS